MNEENWSIEVKAAFNRLMGYRHTQLVDRCNAARLSIDEVADCHGFRRGQRKVYTDTIGRLRSRVENYVDRIWVRAEGLWKRENE